ncbi:MAG: UDP-N-acetylmuramoyl-tripeptide--D-alanyl-D-alanine ligase [Pararhodobacter sp.]|nr:UDP-N-acetylmuramoyl-tripeptide--D-alanyl-D-alanine ligase [Pararhodobacter sp.]
MNPLWTSDAIARATGGRALAEFAVSGISIDSRSLQKGDLFVALSAARDGHDFLADAFARGAAGALVSRIPEGVDGPCVVVDDVLAALAALGAAGRARAQAKVVAVTGSVGKTSTKEMLRAMLAEFGRTHAAVASFNNHWGVPVTLARLAPEADFAVIEIGMNRQGEIEPLARLARPHVALVTTIAPAHLEAFGTLEAIAAEKAMVFRGLEPGGTAVYHADCPGQAELAATAGPDALRFGATGNAARLIALEAAAGAQVARVQLGEDELLLRLPAAGAHFAINALGCLCVARALGLDAALAAQALGRWQPPAGRGQIERVMLDPVEDYGFTLIDDAFNANPASMAAALEVLAATRPGPGGQRLAILGDMLELGPEEFALHRALADHPAMAGIATVHCVGPRMSALWQALPRHQRGRHEDSAEALGAQARRLVQPNDVVLVKGSKGSLVSRVVDALRALGPREATEKSRKIRHEGK